MSAAGQRDLLVAGGTSDKYGGGLANKVESFRVNGGSQWSTHSWTLPYAMGNFGSSSDSIIMYDRQEVTLATGRTNTGFTADNWYQIDHVLDDWVNVPGTLVTERVS